MRAAPALVLLLLLLPAGAQQPASDPGLRDAWERALRDPLVVLPLERPADAEAALARLDRLASAFAESQEMLGPEGSGPLLAAAAPEASALRGVGGDRVAMAQFLSVAAAFRQGRLAPDAHAAASVRLLQVGLFLERMNGPAHHYASAGPAWDEANAWFLRLAPLRDATASLPGANVTVGGSGVPGGIVHGTVHGAPGNGTLRTPWGNVTVGAGTSEWSLPVPGNQAPGNYTGHLVVGGKGVANTTIRIDAIPLTLEVLGPRQVAPLSSATYRIAMSSTVLVTQAGTFAATADGTAVPVADGAFTLDFPASGKVEVQVSGGPGPPWSNASRAFTVQVAAPAATTGFGTTGLTLLVAVPSAALLAAVAIMRARRRTPLPTPTMAARTGLAPDWGLGDRLRSWWSSPGKVIAADYRRAARILGEAGRLDPSATHAMVAAALEAEGVRPKVARRLASAYEKVHYAGAAGADAEYWESRRAQ